MRSRRPGDGFIFYAVLLAATVVTVGQAATAATAARRSDVPVTQAGPGSGMSASPAASAAPNVDVVLYDQYNSQVSASPINVNSQNYEPSNDALDDFAADDFVVPAGQGWRITGVDVDGEYTDTGGAAGSSASVRFYENGAGNLPGTPNGIVGSSNPFVMGPAAGDFVISLNYPVTLGPGTYWVSVQPNQNSNPGRYWGWHDRSVLSNSGSAWMNPGNGWGTGCTAWIRKTSCAPLGNPNPDQVFRLSGTAQTLLPESFEAGTLGAFWSSGSPGWSNVSDTSHSPTHSAFAPDVTTVSDQRLTLGSPLVVPSSATTATLTFWHRFAFEGAAAEQRYDGGVLEGSFDGGITWFDMGSLITSGGYNGTISNCCINPLAGRMAWTGNPNGAAFVQVTVNLLSWKGTSHVVRFREGTDYSGPGGTGWWVDDVVFSTGGPTAVRLTSFDVQRRPSAVDVRWRTASDARLLGFDVWRSSRGNERWVKLNATLIAATGARSYRYLDRSARPGASYAYKLKTVDVDGRASWSRPVAVSRESVGRPG